MLPDFPEITSPEDFTLWSGLLSSVAAFTGDTDFQAALSADPTTVTVGEYLDLLDVAEASLLATDFSHLNSIIPTLEAQIEASLQDADLPDGTTVEDIVDASVGFLEDLAAGDFSFITSTFDTIRSLLEGVPRDTPLFDGLIGTGPVDPGDFDLPQLPDLPTLGWVSGDPHLQTLDGIGYDFQAAGEFVLLQSADAGDFMLQARMVPVGPNVSVNESISTNLDGVAVMIDAADATPLHIGGTATALDDGASIAVGNGRVFRNGDTYAIAYPGSDGVVNDGDSQVLVRVQDGRMDLDVRLNAELLGTLEGLLGDGDGNAANDVALADGTVLARPFTFADLYGTYRDDWRVDTEAESLFTYDAGESLAGFYDPAMPGALVTLETLDPDVRETAEAAAQAAGLSPGTSAYDNAVLDFALTGDTSFLTSALNTPLSLIGTALGEDLTGGEGADVIDGLGGDDQLEARGGNDVVFGGAGNDTIDAGDGDDQINTGIGFDLVEAGGGNDLVQGLNGFDTLNGGAGNDTLEGNAGNDELNGGDGDDVINTGIGFDLVEAGGGNDLVQGLNGFDTLNGGSGNDTLQGNAGNDVMSGGADDDLLVGGIGSDVMSGDGGNDLLQGQGGFDTLDGGDGSDTLQGNNSDDLLNGGVGDDLLEGGFANDVLNGEAGNDTLNGGNGADVLNGGEGDDRLEGNAGSDTLDGGAGTDVLRGGLGADTFVFRRQPRRGGSARYLQPRRRRLPAARFRGWRHAHLHRHHQYRRHPG
jgi:Ca2+-binding RTX toxin-like protein